MFEHETAPIRLPYSTDTVEVDKDIAALIQALWDRGIETEESCQNIGPGSVWIQFSTSHDALMFLSLVASIRETEGPEAADRLYHRMIDGEGGWEYEIAPGDLNLIMVDEEGVAGFSGPPDLVLPVAVRFPVSDYFRVLHLVMQK